MLRLDLLVVLNALLLGKLLSQNGLMPLIFPLLSLNVIQLVRVARLLEERLVCVLRRK